MDAAPAGFVAAFRPFEALAADLIATLPPYDDGSHDLTHIGRVWSLVWQIHDGEGGDLEILAAATLLHDAVAVPKNSPLRSRASRMAADNAVDVLTRLAWAPARCEAVAHAVAAHSFSAGIRPETLEARILQDADRLDGIGALGIARCFYTAGRMGSAMYDPDDPRAETRPLDDARFALDHFEAKLFRIAATMQTATGQRIAREREETMRVFVARFLSELPRA